MQPDAPPDDEVAPPAEETPDPAQRTTGPPSRAVRRRLERQAGKHRRGRRPWSGLP